MFAAIAWLAAPERNDDIGGAVLSALMLLAALAACIKGSSSLSVQYRRRKIWAEANSKSETLGKARYASIRERLAAKAHDLCAPILAGLCDGLPLNIPAGLHLLVESISGAGKTSGLVVGTIWHAAMNGYSVVVPDAKPELAYLWGEALKKAGFRVAYNNPAGLDADRFEHTDSNPYAALVEAAQSENGQQDVFTLADAMALPLIPERENDQNKFFTLNDRNALIFTSVALAAFEPANCYPAKVHEALVDPERFRELCLIAKDEPNRLEGDLAAIASSFLQKRDMNPEHFESACTGAAHALSSFRRSSSLGKIGQNHETDARDLRNETKPPLITFDIMVPDSLETFAKANALTQTARLQGLRRHREGRKVLFLCDEATNLPVPGIIKDMELMRSFGVTIALFYQSRASLRRVYGEHQAESILSSCAQIFFSVTNTQQAEEISKRLGQHTVKAKNYSFGERGESSSGMGEQGHALAAIDDILSLLRNSAFLFLPGCRPILFEKTPYYEAEPFKHLVGDNPNERHPKSKRTAYKLVYSKDATKLGAPTMLDWGKRLRKALAAEKAANKRPRARAFYFRDFLWVPVVSGLAAFALIVGTPHVIFDYATRADARGEYACTYFGPSGLRFVKQQSPCSTFRFIRFQKP